MDRQSSETPPPTDRWPELPPFPLQHYPQELPPSRHYGVMGYILLLLFLPPVSALGGICGCYLWLGRAPLGWVDLAGPAIVGAAFGTVNGLFARAHTKLNLVELVLLAPVVGAIPPIIMLAYLRFFFTISLGP